ncbi:LytS/YhcK type 5TM receptor domain-containing protein [Anaeromyxobacter terrae]|uniref:LytS/YhcK type 5TM receptor domain-containing protein n=1 Tax=Anaeromyxobacter terrae TaxID=2925406 RepID=UPI001F5ABC2C|nr:sensor histidine kinase [Anaeromyxobacter sp. SG22]
MKLALQLTEALSVFLVIFYLYCRSPAFRPLKPDWPRPRGKIRLYLVFSGIAILGNYLGVPVVDGQAIVNARAVGSTLAGLLGGPALGMLVGATAGLHRVTALSGAAAFPGAVSTTLEGLLGGLVHLALKRRPEQLMTPRVAFATTFVGELLHMFIVRYLTSAPPEQVIAIVKAIGPPMVIANPIGAALFMAVLLERQREQDRVAATSSARALKVADRTLRLLARGLGREAAGELAAIIREETGVGAVGVTDTERVVGWSGMGSDHHLPGNPIASPYTRQSIAENAVVFADGVRQAYDCTVSPSCPLNSMVIAPLQVDGAVVGTVQLFEPRGRRFLNMNKSLGEGLGAVLSSQLLIARYQEQKSLLVMSELKLAQAQVNPHFLFNALNTIIAILRRDADRARDLLVHLSNFFRKNLKRSSDVSTLREELEHVGAYLEIEKARFEGRIAVETDVDPELLSLEMPAFTLQPLVENAFKHGLSEVLGEGRATIRAYRKDGEALVEVEDNAGAWTEPRERAGLGMQIVDKRVKNRFGEAFGLSVTCVPHELTRVTVRLPGKGVAA